MKKAGLWSNPNIYTDTALASPVEILDFIRTFGIDKILYGSDYPFGIPAMEKQKILQLGLTGEELDKILWKNIARLLKIPA